MAGQNRYLRDGTNTILAPVHGNVEINSGDLVFINSLNGLVGGEVIGNAIAADQYVYPFNKAVNAGSPAAGVQFGVYTYFAGVAMESSPAGVTENITVAVDGVFRYPLYALSAVTVGSLITSVSPYVSTLGVSPQAVSIIGYGLATTAYLGYVVKTESGASFVDFEIRTIYNKLAT